MKNRNSIASLVFVAVLAVMAALLLWSPQGPGPAAALATSTVETNQYGDVTQLGGTPPGPLIPTQYIAASTTQTFNAEMYVSGASQVAIQVTGIATNAAGTNTTVFTIQDSVDRTNWHTKGSITLTAATGSGATCISNFSTLAVAWFRLSTAAANSYGNARWRADWDRQP